jgi:co-chaperonin GroES (HSP10)
MGRRTITPKLADQLTSSSIVNLAHINVAKPKQPPVRAVKPLGGQVLVEVYDESELSDSSIILPDNAKGKGSLGVGGAPQGRVLDIGPGLPKEFGVKIGDRVLLQGSFVPLPKLMDQRDGDRERALVEPHTIKAILLEDAPESALVTA